MRSTKSPSWSRRLLGLDPLPVPPHVFQLGGGRLAYGRFVAGDGVWDFQERRVVELAADTFVAGPLGGPPTSAEAVGERLDALLEGLSVPVERASLVLPDAWLRVGFVEVGVLPRATEARHEVLRWKLKRLVPFRVEELRLAAVEVTPLAQQEEPRRVLLAFALEALLEALEDAFAARGVRIGQIVSSTLAVHTALKPVLGDGVAAVALVEDGGYTLSFAAAGELLLVRHKGRSTVAGATAGEEIERDLRLTGAFLREQLPGASLSRILLVAPPADQALWAGWLASGLGGRPEPIGPSHLAVRAADRSIPWVDTAPMLGAAMQEVR